MMLLDQSLAIGLVTPKGFPALFNYFIDVVLCCAYINTFLGTNNGNSNNTYDSLLKQNLLTIFVSEKKRVNSMFIK